MLVLQNIFTSRTNAATNIICSWFAMRRSFSSSRRSLCLMVFGGVCRGGRSPLVILKSWFSLNQFTYKDECLKRLLESLPYKMDADLASLKKDEASSHAAEVSKRFWRKKCHGSCGTPIFLLAAPIWTRSIILPEAYWRSVWTNTVLSRDSTDLQ